MAEAALPCTQRVFSISTNRVARAVPPYGNAILTQSMRAQHASNTTARASYHTRLPSFKRLAIALVGYQVGDADDETSRQRGAWDVPANCVYVAFNAFSSATTETATGCSLPRERCSSPRRGVRRLAAQL